MRFSVLLILLLTSCGQSRLIAKDLDFCANVKLQVLGAGGPEIDDGLASSSFLIWHNGKAKIMVDAGGGSSLNFEKSGANFNDLEAILLTHLHVDHSAALPVYIKGGYFTDREKVLSIYGPKQGDGFPSTNEFVAALFSDNQKSAYPYLSDNYRQKSSTDFLIETISMPTQKGSWKGEVNENIEIEAIDVKHGNIPTIAWRVNIGECSVTFTGDMNGSLKHLEYLADGTNILVANNAIPEMAHHVAKRLHMIPSTIAELAFKSKAKKLLLAHFMLRTVDRKTETLGIIKKQYQKEIQIAKELEFYSLD